MEKIPSENLSATELYKKFRQKQWLDLENVGPNKPVGYLPIEIIEDDLGKNIDEVIKYLQNKGLEVKIFTGMVWPGFRGALYAYDKVALQKILDENKQILLDANWPISADEFVANLKVQESIGTPIYKVIAKTFADKFQEQLEPKLK